MSDLIQNFDVSNNLLTLDEAVKWRESLAKQNKKLVLTNGCFDILHRGHVEYLGESRTLGDAMIILLNSDSSVRKLKGSSRPVNDQVSRAFMLNSLRCIDRVVIFDDDTCDKELRAIAPDIYVKGGDYTIDTLNAKERDALIDSGSQICIKKFVNGFSTTKILEKLNKN